MISMEAMQVTTKVLWTSINSTGQILYTIFKAIGTPFRTRSFAKDYSERQHGLNVQDINEIVNEKIRLRKSHLFVLKKADYTYKYSVIRYPEGVL